MSIKKGIMSSILAQVASICVNFIINLIVPKFISELEYSYWQTYMLYVGYVGVLHFGLLDGIVLRYSQYNYDELDKERIRSQFRILIFLNGLFALITTTAALIIAKADFKYIFIYVAIGIITKNLFTYVSYTLQMTNRITTYAALIIAQRLFFGLAVIVLLVLRVKSFHLYCIADLAADMFGFLFCYKQNRKLYIGKTIPFKETLSEFKVNVLSGVILLIANWSSMLLVGSAKMTVQWHWNELTFGKVSFAFSLTNLFLVFVSAISVVLFPSLKRMEQSELPKVYTDIRNIISPVLFYVMLFYFPGCWILDTWLPKYNESLVYLGILLPVIVFTSKVSLLTNNYLKAYRKEKIMLVINLSAVITAFLLFYISAYIINNLKLLLIMVVIVIMLRSIVSEIAVMKIINVKFFKEFIIEAGVTIIFVVLTCFCNLIEGFLIYFAVLLVYTIFNRKMIFAYFKKLIRR